MTREVSVRNRSSRDAGGCNGCTEHTTAAGQAEHRVVEIRLRGCSVRVCRDCLKQLVNLLGKELNR